MAALTLTPAPTPTPTLPPNWTPTSSGCLRSKDFWVWEYNIAAGDARAVVGGPSQTTDCFPSGWTDATGTYTGTQCPPNYSSACQGTDTISAITCCPTIYDFTCLASNTNPHSASFPCVSLFKPSTTITVTNTNFFANTIAVYTLKINTRHLFAMPIALVAPQTSSSTSISITRTSIVDSANPTDSSTSSSPIDAKELSHHSLSPGAAAGIAIGSACVALLGALLIWFLCRRRKRLLLQPLPLNSYPENKHAVPDPAMGYGRTSAGLSELDAMQNPRELQAQAGGQIFR